ncbi:hypothetical protein PHYBOEH_008111 [Phytophthora boehmeriae]|uniref:Heme haloperoxidase family profile domain-containing protein n=1 Tax=Phytophthora boehmeriae TaxID=109152 RepID=A0A8T1W3I1_9STRA|nr:hypothetical protein PHYBOEH_008111 [Phytophthora boehmeriae]
MVISMLRAAFIASFAVLAAQGVTSQACGDGDELQVGAFYKPSADEASGVVGTTATYSRSPCPAVNTLANHGYLPRNGRNITKSMMKAAIMDIFNMANDSATTQVSPLPEVFALDFLSTHDFIEHDASLVRADLYYGFDPMTVDLALAEDFLARDDGAGMINTTAVARARTDRETVGQAENPEYSLSASLKQTAFLQAALLLLALGEGPGISVDHARSFLVDEQIPNDFVKSATPVSVAALTSKYLELVGQA